MALWQRMAGRPLLSTAVFLLTALAVSSAARAEFLCGGLCAALNDSMTERLESLGRAKMEACQATVENGYQKEKHREENCGCFPPAKLQERLEELAQVRKKELGKCRLAGIEVQLTEIAKERAEHIAHLIALIAQFQAQVRELDSWQQDAQRGRIDAYAKIGDTATAAIGSYLLGNSADAVKKRAVAAIEQAAGKRELRRVRTGDLGEWVLALRADLNGKSKAETNAIILRSLEAARSAPEVAAVENQLSHMLVKLDIEKAKAMVESGHAGGGKAEAEPGTELQQFLLDQAYASGVTLLEIGRQRAEKEMWLAAKSATILGFAPDAVDVSELLTRAHAIEGNIDGLDKLRAAAEQERSIATTEVRLLVHRRATLSAQRAKVSAESQP